MTDKTFAELLRCANAALAHASHAAFACSLNIGTLGTGNVQL